MVIYEKTSRYAFHLLHEEKSKVRISEDAYKHNGNLQEIPMQRTFDALRDFVAITASFKVRKTLCVATSALRDAPNQKDFILRVRKELGLNIKVISGEREAYFGAVACSNLLPPLSNALSIDIGGGSTEFSCIYGTNIANTLSLKLGTVRLKELFFDKEDIEGAKDYIDAQLEQLDAQNISTLVGIGGTFRAISSAIMQQSYYPLGKLHAYKPDLALFSAYITKILAADEDQLKALGIKHNRFDVIKPGALILQRIMKKINLTAIITSGVGVREGVYLADLLRNSKHRFPHNFNTSVKYLLDSNLYDKIYSNNLNKVAKTLFDLTAEYLHIPSQYRYELALAAKLYPIGSKVHFYSQNKHTYYLIQTALEYGFTHKSITLIATLAKYAKNKLPSESHLHKYAALLPDPKTTNALSFLLSLSITLLSHRPRNIDFSLHFEDGVLYVEAQHKLYLTQEGVKKLVCDQNFEVRFLD